MRAGSSQRGSVTAEFAIVLPAVVLVLVLVLTTAAVAASQLRCTEAARAGARAAALGEPGASVRAAAAMVAGGGTEVETRTSGEWMVVSVRRPVMSRWGWLTTAAEARAWVEPGVGGEIP
jgi:hypothetical protein